MPRDERLEVTDARRATVGAMEVARVLPLRTRRTVGAWCFVDLMGPGTVTAEQGLDVGPHPHIGLQTGTWLAEGQVLHRDSLGSEQLIRPGELNLMTAGRGVSHAEETRSVHSGVLRGVQLWVALPDAARGCDPAFEHHAELPHVDLPTGDVTVLVGAFAGARSPARGATDHLGAELRLGRGHVALPVERSHEHALVVLDGTLAIEGVAVGEGQMVHVAAGRDEVPLEVADGTRALLLGGTPFGPAPLMWWNYVARTRAEVVEAHRSWLADDGRFGTVSSALPRVEVPGPPWKG